jgi:CBS domain-containing protein
MQVKQLLEGKGREVATIERSRSVADALTVLKERRIGALVVTGATPPLVGIFSERDAVRAFASAGSAAFAMPVANFMSDEVIICHEASTTTDLMMLMTEQRIRHVPVIENNTLVGMISIGDVVKARLHELEAEKRELIDYVSAR